MKDPYDLDLTTARPDTAAAYATYAADWIGYGPKVRSIFQAADADPVDGPRVVALDEVPDHPFPGCAALPRHGP